MKTASIIDIEGIGQSSASKLEAEGIATTEALLEKGATPKERRNLAEKTGIQDGLILKWVNKADLFRVKGIGEQYSDLLEAAGVDTVPELAKRVPANLHAKLVEVNETKKLVRQLPSETVVAGWVEHAKTLPRVMTY